MRESSYAILLVPSTSHAMRAEKLLLASGISCKLIPVPKTISSDCGVCIRFRKTERPLVQQVVEEEKLVFDRIMDL